MKKKILVPVLALAILVITTAAALWCSTCRGSGYVDQKVDCPYCVNGTTSQGYKCSSCQGKGYTYTSVKCGSCDGTGEITKRVPYPDQH